MDPFEPLALFICEFKVADSVQVECIINLFLCMSTDLFSCREDIWFSGG